MRGQLDLAHAPGAQRFTQRVVSQNSICPALRRGRAAVMMPIFPFARCI